MFREMRRKKQLLSIEETIGILERCTSGVLAVYGDDGYPYAVPLSYTYKDDKILFHCATVGHKIDGIKTNDKVSFCVIEKDEVVPEEFLTLYSSVIAFGKARVLTDDLEKREALIELGKKYSPGLDKETEKEINDSWETVCLVEMKIEHVTGKVARKIAEKKNNQ